MAPVGVARNKTDVPVLLIFELIGNDICSPHPDLGQVCILFLYSCITPHIYFWNLLDDHSRAIQN